MIHTSWLPLAAGGEFTQPRAGPPFGRSQYSIYIPSNLEFPLAQAAATFHHPLSPHMNPHYIAALQAAAYQTAALYGAAAVPGYDHEALYRLQLERYAAVTGLAIPGGPSLGAYPSQVTSLSLIRNNSKLSVYSAC